MNRKRRAVIHRAAGSCGRRGRPTGYPRRCSDALDDLDVVGHAGHAVEVRGVVEGAVALVLEVDVALERDPAVPDVDVDVVAGDLGIPDEPLEGGAATSKSHSANNAPLVF